MDMFSQYSDPHPCGSDFWSSNVRESSSEGGHPVSLVSSDEEVVLLASRNPKKRAGRKKFRETRHPVFRGVRRRNGEKWVCEVREPNKKSRIWLGTFPTAEMAARAHDVAAMALRGRGACLNFADSARLLRVPESGDAKDIQKAAAEAAEAFRPSKLNTEFREGNSEITMTSPENVFYMDEETVFGMPGLLANMAEGMMLSPPPPPPQPFPPSLLLDNNVGEGYNCDDVEIDANVSLWSFSI